MFFVGCFLDMVGGGDGFVDLGEFREMGDLDEGVDFLGLKGVESVFDIVFFEEVFVGLSEFVGLFGVDELGFVNEGVGDVVFGRGGFFGGGRDGSYEGVGG